MTESEFLEAMALLESASSLLKRRGFAAPADFLAELRRLTLELDMLRVRVGQAPADSQRN